MIFGTILLVLFVYGLILYFQAKSHIDTAPKQEMFLCQVHGAIPVGACMNINPDGFEYEDSVGGTTRGTVLYCPRCFEDRIREAEARYK